jgi:elongator complex protein 1
VTDLSAEYEVPGDTPETDERCRSIERGAKIVTVIPSMYAVILQMPRGNIETIYPRALVLAGIRQHLDSEDFKSSFLACRKHQVDMNIIYDYRPDLLMSNIRTFIQQVKKVSHIDLFLSKLSEEDVSKSLYKDTMPKRRTTVLDGVEPVKPLYGFNDVVGAKGEDEGKVNRVCDAFLSVLKPKISKYIRNIITTHVCKRPPDLISALELVGSLRRTDAIKAEEAVSHLCFLSDVNRLYDTALSLYDLPLTLLVAQQAQRDPREYIPFLQSLNALPQLQRNFRIDDHLRDYAKALESLHALTAHEDVEAYTIKHALYPEALKLYRYDVEHLTAITRLHASYLTSQSCHLASAIASESVSDYALASSSYSKCSPPRWREALHCTSMIHPSISTSQLHTLALKLATALTEEQRDYRSSSQIHTDYLHDIPTSARLLCKGSYFAESLRLLSLNNLTALIPDIIDTSLAEKSGELTELIADCRAQLSAQIPRIKELRLKKAEDPLAFFGGDPAAIVDGAEGDIPDNISLAPTNASTLGGQSLFTRYGNGSNISTRFGGTVASNMSRKTSKTRRREERKRARGKKGSVYEEEYLVASVRRLVEKVNGLHDEVRRLVEGLLRRGMRNRSEAVEEAVRGIVKECERAVREVWGTMGGEHKEAASSGGEDAGLRREHAEGEDGLAMRPKGADGVFWESQIEAQQGGRDAPEVKIWRGLDL